MRKNKMKGKNEAVTNIEDALNLCGGVGTFQIISFLVNGGNYIRAAMTSYPLPYMELYPQYLCHDIGSTKKFECTPSDFCGNPKVRYEVDWSSNKSLHNWVE